MKSPIDLLWHWLEQWRRARLPAPSRPTWPASDKVFLHVGCGPARKAQAGPGLQSGEWRELRLDIDPAVQPDIVGTMLDMSAVADESVDAVFSSHNIEHLYPHEVPVALREFLRVLKADGVLILTCPDLQSVCRLVADDRLDDTAYVSPLGPITPLDILYGLRPPLAAGNPYMAHHTGFTLRTLMAAARSRGFQAVAGRRREAALDLWLLAAKQPRSEDEMARLAELHLPS